MRTYPVVYKIYITLKQCLNNTIISVQAFGLWWCPVSSVTARPRVAAWREGLSAAEWGIEIGEPVDLIEHVDRFSILSSLAFGVSPVEEYIGGKRWIHSAYFFDERGDFVEGTSTISKLRGTKGTSNRLRHSQSRTLAGQCHGQPVSTMIVVVFGSQFKDFSSDSLAGELGAPYSEAHPGSLPCGPQ